MRWYLIISVVTILSFGQISARDPDSVIHDVADCWLSLHNNFGKTSDVWGDYTLDLTLESLLKYDELTGQSDFIMLTQDVMASRNILPSDTISYRSQPFCSINFTLGEVTGNPEWHTGFISESYKMYNEAKRSSEGAVLHNHKGGYYILIDFLQEYGSRMAKTGYLTRDTLLYTECIQQFLIYESLLRHPANGLWSQGRGWCDNPNQLSPGAWSRGHGWLLRGLVTSLQYLPDYYQNQLIPVLKRIAYSLLDAQDENGMWHILLHLPFNESEPDVSGTGMMAYYMSLAIKNGWLEGADFKPSVLKSASRIKHYVNSEGEIFNSCKGPGPLISILEYRDYQPGKNEKHGFQAVIYGMMAEMILSQN
jgi:rhamnogalacturonyl hydrolase YesR